MMKLNLLLLILPIILVDCDRVEDVQKFATDIKTYVDALIKNVRNHKSNIYKQNRKNWGDLTQAKNSIYATKNTFIKEIGDMRIDFKPKVDKTSYESGMKELAQEKVSSTMKQDFTAAFNAYQEFIQLQRDYFNGLKTSLNETWLKVLGIDDWIENTRNKLENATFGDADVDRLSKELLLISRQVQLQQFNEQEKVRSDGNSGIKQIRTRRVGEKNYYSSTHTGRSFASIHDHSNNIRTVGMGEFIGVLNGVEFRTRHNDYRLKMPANTKQYHATQDIPFPDVPPQVLAKGSVTAQVEEMRKWFKAFHEQDHSIRDYRKYFKPILCYLEGTWHTTESGNIDEPFESDRHHIEASSWFDLQEKIYFTSYTGAKNIRENLAHLPTTIMDFTDKGKPIFAQWNYRILCHPLKKDLPTKYLQVVLDPANQKFSSRNAVQYENSRSARFDLLGIKPNGDRTSGGMKYTYMDSLMEEIPGKDNYAADIVDAGFDSEVVSANPNNFGQKLNAGFYHRPYKLKNKDAMGVSSAQRGYADNFYFALTTQDKIAGPSYTTKEGVKKSVRGSYAIPVEIIYLTPLVKWNPYNLEFKSNPIDVSGDGSREKPFTNTAPRTYFRTPHEFFSGKKGEVDPADTARAGGVFVKTKNGQSVAVHASGTRIMFPEIPGINGIIRQRYPIMPIYGEGSSVWKKLNALEDSIDFSPVTTTDDVSYYSIGRATEGGIHNHVIIFQASELQELKEGKKDHIKVRTGRGNGHIHTVNVSWSSSKQDFYVSWCDGEAPDIDGYVCSDKHINSLSTSNTV